MPGVSERILAVLRTSVTRGMRDDVCTKQNSAATCLRPVRSHMQFDFRSLPALPSSQLPVSDVDNSMHLPHRKDKLV